ncbi:MAG TPA: hypothetical protein VE987_08785 [Polyangiaceae bacterium]|nr:hypothetical protein [Polyangiaceae bacterium]
MQRRHPHRTIITARRALLLLVALSVYVARDAPARAAAPPHSSAEAAFSLVPRSLRVASWARALEPIEVRSMNTRIAGRVRLYDATGELDDDARATFERIASREPEPHRLATRVEQLIVKAAYHFGAERVLIVSGWRANAGKHGTGDAVDFKLQGVRARDVAAYLRGLPRVGVGLYTHPATQFVHLDVREPSYHWLDSSAPGAHGREVQLGDPRGEKRDAAYTPDMDLP